MSPHQICPEMTTISNNSKFLSKYTILPPCWEKFFWKDVENFCDFILSCKVLLRNFVYESEGEFRIAVLSVVRLWVSVLEFWCLTTDQPQIERLFCDGTLRQPQWPEKRHVTSDTIRKQRVIIKKRLKKISSLPQFYKYH